MSILKMFYAQIIQAIGEPYCTSQNTAIRIPLKKALSFGPFNTV